MARTTRWTEGGPVLAAERRTPESRALGWREGKVTMIDPAPFRRDAITEETLAINASVQAARKDLLTIPPSPGELRRRLAEMVERTSPTGLYASPLATTRTVDAEGRSLELRVLVPVRQRPKGIFVYLHGGGWTIGSPDAQDPRLEVWAEAGMVVVAPRYRLAPEHPFPAGLDDCEAATLWVMREGLGEFGVDRYVLGGESAGANLAVTLATRLRAAQVMPPRAMALVYGSYDLSVTPSQRLYGDRPGTIGTSLLGWFYDQYVGEERRRDPEVSPLFADLRDLPPAGFVVGTLDPLLDDTLFLHARWLAAGNRATLHVAPGGLHGFNAFPGRIATAANEFVAASLADALADA